MNAVVLLVSIIVIFFFTPYMGVLQPANLMAFDGIVFKWIIKKLMKLNAFSELIGPVCQNFEKHWPANKKLSHLLISTAIDLQI